MKATICIPTVSRLEFFREALGSAASQSFQDYEVLVSVNSEDPDYFGRVAALVEEAKREHPARAIRMVQPPRFLHIAEHTNFMVEHSSGTYWCYLGDDDRMEPGFLRTLLHLLQAEEEAGFAFCTFLNIDRDGKVRRDLSALNTHAFHIDHLEEGFIAHSALPRLALWNALMFPCALFRRAVLEDFPFAPGNEAPDRDFWLRIADSSAEFGAVYTPSPLLNYRLHDQQYSSASRAAQSDFIETLAACRNVAAAEPGLHKRILAQTYARLGKALLDEGDRAGARRALLAALSKNPVDLRTYRFAMQAALPGPLLESLRRIRRRSLGDSS